MGWPKDVATALSVKADKKYAFSCRVMSDLALPVEVKVGFVTAPSTSN